MPADVITVDGTIDYEPIALRAAEVLRGGGIVVFPTETVYGVGARADLPEAVARLRKLKDRTDRKPFTVHIPRRTDAGAYVPAMAGPARRLVEKGWPGPLTLLFQVDDLSAVPILAGRNGSLASEVYFEGLVGLRCPDHPIATRLLADANGPVVAASANLAGHHPPRTAEEAVRELGDSVDMVIDGGPAQFAQASTIVRLKGRDYEIVREGVYDERTVRRLACMNLLFVCSGNTCRSPMAAALCATMLARKLNCAVTELGANNVAVRSAGTFAMDGAKASGEAVAAMQRRGIDLTRHAATPLTPELINQADRIFAMTRGHLETIVAMSPTAASRAGLLGGESEIDDPVGQSHDVYETCAEEIERALARRLEEVEP